MYVPSFFMYPLDFWFKQNYRLKITFIPRINRWIQLNPFYFNPFPFILGENVSTAEVEEVATRGAGHTRGCVVYGVKIPGIEGRLEQFFM